MPLLSFILYFQLGGTKPPRDRLPDGAKIFENCAGQSKLADLSHLRQITQADSGHSPKFARFPNPAVQSNKCWQTGLISENDSPLLYGQIPIRYSIAGWGLNSAVAVQQCTD